VRSAFAATRAVMGPYEADFRIMIGDDVHWIVARGQGKDVGIFLDATGRKRAEEGNEFARWQESTGPRTSGRSRQV
jgi:hypothetical protein